MMVTRTLTTTKKLTGVVAMRVRSP
jgi:hypothetical protein